MYKKEKYIKKSVFKFLKNKVGNIVDYIERKKEYLKSYSNDKNLDKLKYSDLAPVDNIEKSKVYFEALDWAIENENITNIALTGPYGAGKSSIIKSYIKERPHLKCINISLASFYESKKISDEESNIHNEEESNSENEKSKSSHEDKNKNLIYFSNNQIEEGILKQLFYKVDYKKIPHSRYRKIKNLSFKKVLFRVVFFIIVSSGLFFIFKPDKLKEIQNSIKKFSDMFNIENLFVISISFIGISILITLISYVIWILLINFKVAKVNLLEKAEMQKKTTTDSSVFNKNLDEILYFFETNNYNIVFIEDLDRFENAEIFVKLRELNTLINNYEMIKNRMIFIYAVKDDMFTKSDRTKFFDFIIPVIPIINSSNSGEKILKKVKIDKISESISEGFINKISVYIDDMRILNNIFNEFNVFKNITEDIKGLDDEKMFVLMTFKNLYPREFADYNMKRE